MNDLIKVFEELLGKSFVAEMLSRLTIILGALAAAVLLVILIAVWKKIACGKIKKAILALSEHPNDAQAKQSVKDIDSVSAVGKFFARHSKNLAGLSKGDCRTIFNTTVLTAEKISDENKTAVRTCLINAGCDGLTDIA